MTHKYYKSPKKIEGLSEIQRNVTQNNSTERPFTGVYNKHFEEGLYVDIVSGEPLFTSLDKFDSGCGWPAFSNVIEDNINEVLDVSHGMIRTEVRSIHGDSHLGHVFTDGPQNKGGLRYCINSAALRFIPKTDLEREGYKKYLKLFNTGGKHED